MYGAVWPHLCIVVNWCNRTAEEWVFIVETIARVAPMAKVLFTIQIDPEPTLAQVKERLGLSDEQIDPDFGVVVIDPDEHLYAILVDAEAAITDEAVKGPYSNPQIGPLG